MSHRDALPTMMSAILGAQMKAMILIVFSVLASLSAVHAEGLLNSVKQGVSGAIDVVTDTAKSITEEETPAETRKKIDAMADSTLQRLLAQNSGAKKLYDQSFGYAVFDTRKFSFMITTGYGAGVAIEKSSGNRTYMKMATGGANIGIGGEFFQLVILFEDEKTFRSFMDRGIEAGTAASAVLGADSTGADIRFTDGTAVYQLTEKGLKLSADITGTKYWKDDDLN
jgi:lipid-binding SYLF domain-containing protein